MFIWKILAAEVDKSNDWFDVWELFGGWIGAIFIGLIVSILVQVIQEGGKDDKFYPRITLGW